MKQLIIKNEFLLWLRETSIIAKWRINISIMLSKYLILLRNENKMLDKLLYLILSLCLSNIVCAQKKPVIAAQDRVLLHKADTLYQFYAVTPPKKLKPQQESIYYWYRDDIILITQGGYNGRILHGDFRIFYPNNNLKENGRYRYGLREGTWKTWRPSGALASVTTWKDGHLHGAFTEFDEKGQKIKDGSYKNGLLSGNLTEYLNDGKSKQTIYNKGVRVEINDTQPPKKDSASSASKINK
jgi:hypothetical protein